MRRAMVLLVVLAAHDAWAGKLYFSEKAPVHAMFRANLDGSQLETVLTESGLGGLDLDLVRHRVYYVASSLGPVRRACLDGSQIEDVVFPPTKGLTDVAIDEPGAKLYWAAWFQGHIGRSDLDGSNVETLVSTDSFDLTLDVAAGKVYWTSGGIKRANLDGTNVEVVVTESTGGVDVDPTDGRIYWLNNAGTPRIRRAHGDGSAPEDVIVLPVGTVLTALAIDPVAQDVYWGETTRIRRAHLDGSGIETVIDGHWPAYITLDPQGLGQDACGEVVPATSPLGAFALAIILGVVGAAAAYRRCRRTA